MSKALRIIDTNRTKLVGKLADADTQAIDIEIERLQRARASITGDEALEGLNEGQLLKISAAINKSIDELRKLKFE